MAFAFEEEEPTVAAKEDSFACRLPPTPLLPFPLPPNHSPLIGLRSGVTAGEDAENCIGCPCGLEGALRDLLLLFLLLFVGGESSGGGAENEASFGAPPLLLLPPRKRAISVLLLLPLAPPPGTSEEASVAEEEEEEEAAAGLTGAETSVGGG